MTLERVYGPDLIHRPCNRIRYMASQVSGSCDPQGLYVHGFVPSLQLRIPRLQVVHMDLAEVAISAIYVYIYMYIYIYICIYKSV